MAGLTDAPMREMVAEFGVDAVVSEMIASQEWKTHSPSTKGKSLKGALKNTKYIVQIAGRDPHLMTEIARFLEDEGADQIDINMGCPAKHVNSGATAGAALLKDWDLALKIVENVSKAVHLPVSVKTRLGWAEKDIFYKVKDLENAGAQHLTIHARTRAQKYQGEADWQAVRAIKDRISIPLWVNGDIVSTQSARRALQLSQADGVMIGRASTGAPWLLSQIRQDLQLCAKENTQQKNPSPLFFDKLTTIIGMHFEKLLLHYGQEMGIRMARKHLKAYLAPIALDKAEIHELLTATSPQFIFQKLEGLNV